MWRRAWPQYTAVRSYIDSIDKLLVYTIYGSYCRQRDVTGERVVFYRGVRIGGSRGVHGSPLSSYCSALYSFCRQICVWLGTPST